MQQSAATVSLIVDAVGYLLPFLGDDGKLHRLAVGVNHIVAHKCHYKQNHKAIHYLVDAVEKQIAARYDKHIGVEYHAPYSNIGLLRHHRRHNISAAGASVVYECKSHSKSAHYRTENDIHKRLIIDKRLGEQRLHDSEEKTYHAEAKHRAYHKGASHHAECHQQQQHIERVIGDCHRNTKLEIDQR